MIILSKMFQILTFHDTSQYIITISTEIWNRISNLWALISYIWSSNSFETSGVARSFPGGQLAHPEGQDEEENK